MVAVVPVISYDLSVAIAHARLLVATRKAGRPRGAHDLIIAATAVAGGRVVVTADPTGLRTCLASRFATTADTTGTGGRPTGVADGPGHIERLIDAIYDEMGWA